MKTAKGILDLVKIEDQERFAPRMPVGADEAEESGVRTARSREGCTEHTGGSISVDCRKQVALASGDQFPCECVVAFADFDVESSTLIVERPD